MYYDEDFKMDSTLMVRRLSRLTNKKKKTEKDNEEIEELMNILYPNGL